MFTIKYFPDGTIERLKACLVAKSISIPGNDYADTFFPVAKFSLGSSSLISCSQPELALAPIGCEECLQKSNLTEEGVGVGRGNLPAFLLRESHGKYEDYGGLSMV